MPVCCCCGMSLGVTQTQAVRRANTRNISSLFSVISYWQSNRPPLLLSLDRVYNSSASTRLSMIFFWKRQTRSKSRASNIGKWNQTGMAMTLGRKDLKFWNVQMPYTLMRSYQCCRIYIDLGSGSAIAPKSYYIPFLQGSSLLLRGNMWGGHKRATQLFISHISKPFDVYFFLFYS